MDYLDFEIEIGLGSGRDYPITVVHSPGGEAREMMHFPFEEPDLENRLKDVQIALLRSGSKRRQALSPEAQVVRDFGRDLFNALLVGQARSCYDVSQERAVGQGKGLRLKLRIQPPELAVLPWEFIYDSRQAEYVCLSTKTPLVRYLELPQPIQPLAVTPPLRILGMIASPSDLPQLDVKLEAQRLEATLKELKAQGMVELTWLSGQSWRDLQRAMRTGAWHVFHFIGHGGFDRHADEGLITLAGETGESHPLHATELGRLLADSRSLRLALLNACEGARGGAQDVFSSTASILVRRGIPAVLAMQDEITDRAAVELTRSFYEAVADGMPVDAALAEARKAVSLAIANTIEWGTPVLYMRSPDGILFNLQATTPPRQEIDRPAEQVQRGGAAELQEQKETAHRGRESAERAAQKHPEAEPRAKSVPKMPRSQQRTQKVGAISDLERTEPQAQERATAERDVKLAQEKAAAERVSRAKAEAARGSRAKVITAANAEQVQLLRELKGHEGAVISVAFSPDGSILASGGHDPDNSVRLWRVSDGTSLFSMADHKPGAAFVNFSPDGTALVTGTVNGKVRIYPLPLADGSRPRSWQAHGVQEDGVRPEIALCSLAISPDGKFLASGGKSDLLVRLWRVSDGSLVRELKWGNWRSLGYDLQVGFSADGAVLMAVNSLGTVKLWRTADGSPLREIKKQTNLLPLLCDAMSDFDHRLMTQVDDDTPAWCARVPKSVLDQILKGHSKKVLTIAVALSLDKTVLATGSYDQTVKLWRVPDGHLLATLQGFSKQVNHVAFSPDGALLATASGGVLPGDNVVRLWGIEAA